MRLFLLFFISLCSALYSAEKPNIIFIMADDLGWKDVGFMGAEFFETPNLDKLAKEGMIFNQAYSGGPNCSPTRACLMSGTYAPRHKIYTPGGSSKGVPQYMPSLVPARERKDKGLDQKAKEQFEITNVLSPDFVCIPEILKTAGYTSIRLGKWHLGEDLQGFDFSTVSGNDGPQGKRYGNVNVAHTLTDRALSFMEEYKNKPFFLYLSHWDVHGPIRAKKEVVAKYKKKLNKIKGDHKNFNPVYAGMIEAVDKSVGRVVNKVDELGLSKKTLIIFISDNGGLAKVSQLSPLRGCKGSLLEAGIRVPCAMRWTGKIKAGSKNNIPITSVDFLPTFAKLAGAKIAKKQIVDGSDISPVLLGDSFNERSIFWHYPLYLKGLGFKRKMPDGKTYEWRGVPSTAMRKGPYKLIEIHDQNRFELYNIVEDQEESKDLMTSQPELAKALIKEMKVWQKETKAPLPTVPNPEYSANLNK